jgi:serine kinase of HPr protein (carbohydrate metabolism regulator)
MSLPPLSSETVHASCVAIAGRAILIGGRSGAGKSDLALRLIDRGARLVSDDYTILRRSDGRAIASAPATILGRIEVRGIGLVEREAVQQVPVALFVDLDNEPERLPGPGESRMLAGVAIPVVRLAGLEASAPLKVEAALALFGLPG